MRYPSAPLPLALNIASKILAFVTALTLFLPQRQPAESGVPGAGRPHRRCLAGAVTTALAIALVTAGCSSAGQPAGTQANTAGQASGPVWLCQPGQQADPCTSSLTASAVTASGTVQPATWPSSPVASKFACFYVYPTASLATTANAGLAATALEKYIANEQTAPFSQVCNVWAPVYREQTFPTVLKGLAGDQSLMSSTFTVAYDSVLPAWQWFLAHSGNKPIILIGDSQGAAVLIHLISAQLDREPSVLRRLLVAILVGGNLQVPLGETVGATFTKVPLCTSATQTGCAIAFSSYSSEPPADSVFGRPGQGTSLQSLQTAKVGPAWGYHAYEYELTLGNLLRDVAGEEAAWESSL